MSISLLSHRLVFRNANTLPLDLEDRMKSAFKLGRLEGDSLRKLGFRAIEAHSRKLPDELLTEVQNYACDRAIASAYYHGISTKLLATKMDRSRRDEAKKIAARTQRLVVQLILSVREADILRLQHPTVLPDWASAFIGALSVARAAIACHKVGLEVRYPRPVVDVSHFVDLFCQVNERIYLAIQVKTDTSSKAFLVGERAQGDARSFLFGVSSLAKSAQKRGITIVPVWTTCSRRLIGLDSEQLRTDFGDIASRLSG